MSAVAVITGFSRFAALMLLTAAAGCATAPASGSREEPVTFPGTDVSLTGILFTPAVAPRAGRRPAVVLMHGCSGMLDSRGRLPTGRREWAEQFARWGHVALHVDSFAPRGLGSLCDLKDRPAESFPWTARTADAYAALDLLAARVHVDPQRVFVLGWSHGGSTVMGVVRPEAPGRRESGPRFKAAIAFYPGCAGPLRLKGYRTSMPLLILHGEDDDWVPAAPCVALAQKLTAADSPFQVKTVAYPGARHGFDSIRTPVRLVPNVHNPLSQTGRGAWVGGHEPSRLKAVDEVKRFVDSQQRRGRPAAADGSRS